MQDEYRTYIVKGAVEEAPRVVTLDLLPQEGPFPRFFPGQFVNVASPHGGTESKSYSIARSLEGGGIALTVKAAGKTSGALATLGEGGRVRLSGPYGFFYPVDETTPRIFVAGGIGIVPFMSILRAAREKGAMPETSLLYSNRSAADIAFLDELRQLEGQLSLRVTHFLTRELSGSSTTIERRIGESDLVTAARESPRALWYLCGGIAFVRDMRLHLKRLGISEDAIFAESFF